MFGRPKTTQKENNDLLLLKEAMRKIIAGDFHDVSMEGYEDTELPDLLNQTMYAYRTFNNNFIMRLNEAMEAIGDNSYVKNLLDQVSSQSKDIEAMEDASRNLEDSIGNISTYMGEIRNNIHTMLAVSENSTANMKSSMQVVNESSEKIIQINRQIQNFRGKIDEINDIVNVVRSVASQSNLLALNASIEAARAGEAGRGFAVVAEQVRQLSSNTTQSAGDIQKYVQELQTDISALAKSMDETTIHLSEGNEKVEVSLGDIEQMNSQIVSINDSADKIFEDIDKQSIITTDFSRKVDNIANSYAILSEDCNKTGVHFFKIGRYIDTCRSDMYREAGCVTTQDKLKVFEVDHFILMWRIYNHAMGFESLRLNQVNNNDKCKLGLWLREQTDTRITQSSPFRATSDAHDTLHKYATASWKAKDKGDIAEAMVQFSKCYDAYFVFQEKIHALQKYMQTLGYTEETKIVIFRK